jgi:hypothetical protein
MDGAMTCVRPVGGGVNVATRALGACGPCGPSMVIMDPGAETVRAFTGGGESISSCVRTAWMVGATAVISAGWRLAAAGGGAIPIGICVVLPEAGGGAIGRTLPQVG